MPKQINAKLYRLAKTQTDIDTQNQWRDMLTQVADSGALLIDGANIAADTIYGRSIVAESITADKIKSGSITADHITSGGITADVLTGGSLESIVPLTEGGSLINLNTGDFNLAGGNLTWNNTTKVLTLNASQIIIGEQQVATKEDIEARVPIAQLIENINNHPSTTRISGAKMHFTNDVTFDQSFHTKLFAQTGFIEKLGAYEFSADNIKTGTLSSANGMSTMDLNTGAFSFAAGKLTYDGTTLSVIGSLTVTSFAPALKTSFDAKLDTAKLAESGQVTIHGGNITAGTLTADKITTGTLDASKVTVTNLNATNITAGTLDVGKLTLQNLSASDIKTGTLDASSVTIENLSANSIKGGSLDLSKGLSISDGVNDILSIGTDGKVALNASSINIGILPVATKKDVEEIALTPGPQGISVKGVTEYYLSSALSEGITKDTPGWTTEIQPLTPENKYLWNKEIVHYSDDSTFNDKTEILSGTEIFTDKADEGAVVHVEVDGKSYQHAGSGKNIMQGYSQLQRVTSTAMMAELPRFKVENGKDYVLSFRPVNNATTWRPAIGIWKNGELVTETGSEITKVSFPFAYFNSTNKWYQGASNSTLTVYRFTPYDDYEIAIGIVSGDTTKDSVSLNPQMEIGSIPTEYEPPTPSPNAPIEIHSLNDFDVVSSVGRKNLIKNSDFRDGLNEWKTNGSEYVDVVLEGGYVRVNRGGPNSGPYQNISSIEVGDTVTISALIRGSGNIRLGIHRSDSTKIEIPSDWKRVSVTITKTGTGIAATFYTSDVDSYFDIRDVQVEFGTKSTPYSPNYEEITENDNHPLIDKLNLLLDEPLRSVGDVKDRLFKDTDGLWKVERNVSEIVFDGTESFNLASTAGVVVYGTVLTDIPTEDSTVAISSHYNPIPYSLRNNQIKWGDFYSTASGGSERFYFAHEGLNSVSEYKDWVDSQATKGTPLKVVYKINNPTIEPLPQSSQDKLNNLSSFKDSNYIYTVLSGESSILQESLKPTLHATFKSKAWTGNHAGYPSVIGVYGDSAKLLYLSTTAETMAFDAAGTPTPASQIITLTANLQNTLGTATFLATPYNGTTALTGVTLGGVGNVRTLTQAQFPAAADRVQVRVFLNGLEDTVTIMKLKHGLDGQNAVVGYLTNESVTLPANSAGTVAPASFVNATGTFKVFDGLVDKTTTAASTFRVKTQTGAVATINSSGVYVVSSMSLDSAQIVFEVTYNGVKIDQTLSLSKSKEGSAGISITKVDVEYYLHTSATVAPPTTGWNTTAPPWVDGRYMWSKTVTTYSSGDPTTSAPACITGAKGTGGATGRGITSIVEQFYLSDSKTVEPPTSGWLASPPTWSPGKYIWTRSLITYTSGTPATSTTKPLVSSEWEAVNELEIGGRNKLKNTKTEWTQISSGGVWWSHFSGHNRINLEDLGFNRGDVVTFSADIKPSDSPSRVRTSAFNASNSYQSFRGENIPIGQEGRSYVTFKIPSDTTDIAFGFDYDGAGTKTTRIEYRREQVEKGNKATDWSPAPEDVQLSIGEKADGELTNKAIQEAKQLAYTAQQEAEAKASREQVDALESMYQGMESARQQDMTNVSGDLETALERVAAIETNLGDQALQLNFVNTHIRMSNEGLVLGDEQQGNYLLQQPHRLDFISNGTVVAYVSNNELWINSGIFTDRLKIGDINIVKQGTNRIRFE